MKILFACCENPLRAKWAVETISREEHKTIYSGVKDYWDGHAGHAPPPCLPEHLHLSLSLSSLSVKHTFLLHGGEHGAQ